jgi:lipopolysaccharide export system permease protein
VRLYLTRSLAVLVGLVLVLMALDLLGESGKILAVPGNTDADLWRYAGLRLPLLVSRFLPFSILLGTLIVFVALSQNSEVVAMKAAGPVRSPASCTADPSERCDRGACLRFQRDGRRPLGSNRQRVERQRLPPRAGRERDFDQHLAGPRRRSHPRPACRWPRRRFSCRRRDDLPAARGRASTDNRSRACRSAGQPVAARERASLRHQNERDHPNSRDDGLAGVTAEQLRLAKVVPEQTSFFELREKIAAMEAAGKPTAEARAGLWHKISSPMSILLMPLLAAVAAFGLARSGQVLLRATIGMALGFAYFVADNFSLAMGNVGVYPPVLAAWAPFFLFLLVGETVLVRSEE